MSIEEYKLLCSLFDSLLTNSRSTPSRVAIEWLHYIRPHPVFIKRYKLLYRNFLLGLLRKILSYSFHIIRSFAFSLSSLSFPRSHFKDVPSADICFVSHLTDSSQLKTDLDPYFGNLSSNIVDLGFSTFTILINHEQKIDHQSGHANTFNKLILLDRLDFFSELNIFLKLCITSCTFLMEAILSPNLLNIKICIVAFIESFSPSTIANHRYAVQLKYLLALTQSKFLISTFEGFGWERFLFAHARICDPNIKCCGFQHSSIFPHHHSIGRSLSPSYDPDIVFSSGFHSLEFFSSSSLCSNTFVTVLGSPKVQCNSSPSISSRHLSNSILVLPEGIITEAEILLKFTLASALLMPNFSFIFRMHPVLPFASLSSSFNPLSLPDNVSISNKPFADDLKHVDYALYRGSTSIIEAVNNSIVPIYLHMHAEICISPLHQYNGELFQVSSPNDLSLLVQNSSLANYDIKSLQYFTSALYRPLSLSSFKSILGNYG